ncbi:MAG: type II toxin-antitoxin system YafQ family toxin [Bacteroidaceae bacterium]|nr:type II toxin-antitoxin system YafQ family toxin [Bacteroidaceae bacterium]
MKYTIKTTKTFTKDLKLMAKRGGNIEELYRVVGLLANGEALPVSMRDHALSGDFKGHRECHIRPDWLLIYKIDQNVLVLSLVRTGTHSDLF